MRALSVGRFWLGLAAGCVLLVGLVLVVVAVVPAAVSPWRSTVVGSGSMAPRFETGDVVALSPIREGQRIGPPSVVLVEDPTRETPLLHRIVDVDDEGYITQGDANAQRDSEVAPFEFVHAAGRLLVPLVGRPVLWAADGSVVPLVTLFVVLAALTVLARYGWSDRHDPWAGPEPLRPPAVRRVPAHLATGSRRAIRVAVPTVVVVLLAGTGLTQVASGATGVPVAAAAFNSSASNTSNMLQTQVLDPPTGLGASTQCGATTTPTAVWSGSWYVAGSVTWTPSSAGVLQAGDLVLTQQVMRRTYGFSGPAGWDLVVNVETGTNDTNDFVTRIWSRVLTSSDLTTTFTWWYSGGHPDSGFVAIRGASGVSAHAEAVFTGTSFTSITAPSAPVGASNSLLVSFGWANATQIQATPSGMTQRYRNSVSGSTWWVAAAVGAASTPSTGSRVFTLQNASRASAANLVVSPLQSYTGSTVSWTHSTDAWATGYETRKAGDSVWTLLAGKPSTASVVPPLGVPTTYEVRSVAGTWRSTPASVTTTATCP